MDGGKTALEDAIARVAAESIDAVDDGYQLIVYSDRGISAERAPISPMLIVGRAHQVLVHARKRTKIGNRVPTFIPEPLVPGLMFESGETREVHQFCTLLGYGADAICPYVAVEALNALHVRFHFWIDEVICMACRMKEEFQEV